jgi:hypothetical protein
MMGKSIERKLRVITPATAKNQFKPPPYSALQLKTPLSQRKTPPSQNDLIPF